MYVWEDQSPHSGDTSWATSRREGASWVGKELRWGSVTSGVENPPVCYFEEVE